MNNVLVTHPKRGLLLIDRSKRTAVQYKDDNQDNVIKRTASKGLISISYDLISNCNYNCIHCLVDVKIRPENEHKIIDEIEKTGAIWLQITGGEPLIHPDFENIYNQAWDHGLVITVMTNGMLLERFYDTFRKRPPYRIGTSLYGGTKETYELMTRRNGSFEAFLRGMESIRELKIPVRVKGIITKINHHETKIMKDLGSGFGEYFEFRNLIPTMSGNPFPTSLCFGRNSRSKWTDCGAARSALHVLPDGSIAACKASTDTRIPLGWWDFFSELRTAIKPPDPCSKCNKKCSVCPPVYKLLERAGIDPCKE